jgi:hypothetical protein
MAKRRQIPKAVVNKVLLDSKRRCCICYGEGSFEPIEGAIAHLRASQAPGTDTEENLVYLCLNHHAALDSGQLSIDDVVAARRKLFRSLELEDREKEAKLPPWQKYQQKVVEILRQEMFDRFGDFFSFIPESSLHSRSGLRRMVDLAIGLRVLGFELLIAVEIKYSSRPLTVSDVESIGVKFQDLGAAKGIIVCNSGFSPEAIQRAESMASGLRHIEADLRDSDTEG